MSENNNKHFLFLKDLADRINSDLLNLEDAMVKLWQFMCENEDGNYVKKICLKLDHGGRRKILINSWHKYLSKLEETTASVYLDNRIASSALSLEGYIGLNKEMSVLDFALDEKSFLVVGPGPFPESMLEIYKLYPSLKSMHGIDRNDEIIELSNNIIKDFFPIASNIRVLNADAEIFDYSDIDVIFIANGIVNKGIVLDRILKTANKNIKVIVRNPLGWGNLIYENVFDLELSNKFLIRNKVQASTLSETYLIEFKS